MSNAQHRHPNRRAGSKVFTRRPPKYCRCWSSTTAPHARRRHPRTPLPPATTKSMQGSHPQFEHIPTEEGSRPPLATTAANRTSRRPHTAKTSAQAPNPPRPPDAVPITTPRRAPCRQRRSSAARSPEPPWPRAAACSTRRRAPCAPQRSCQIGRASCRERVYVLV